MRFWNKSVNRLAVAVFLGACVLSGAASAMTVDRVVAKVNNEIVTLSSLVERYFAEMARYQQSGMAQDLPPKDQVMRELLDKIIDEKLLIQDGKKIGIKVEEENILKAIDDIQKANNLNEEQLKEMLESEATTLDQYKETIRNQIMVSKIVGFQVRNRTKVADRDVKAYYNQHRKEFWTPAQVKARHILFIMEPTQTQEQREIKQAAAKEVLARLKSGEKFEDLARQFSEDVSAANGGDLGFLERGKMVAEFEQAVFNMKQGEISDLVITPYGVHIIKVDSILPGKSQPFDEVKAQIENTLAQKKFSEVYAGYISDLRKAAFIEKSLFNSQGPKDRTLKPLPDSLNGLLKKDDRKERGTSQRTRKRSRSRKMGSERVPQPIQSPSPASAPVREKPQVDPDSILPPLTIEVPGQESSVQHEVASTIDSPRANENPVPGTFEEVQKALQEIKKMRDRKIISEGEYQKRKKELLKNLN